MDLRTLLRRGICPSITNIRSKVNGVLYRGRISVLGVSLRAAVLWRRGSLHANGRLLHFVRNDTFLLNEIPPELKYTPLQACRDEGHVV
jgi:hypothetical protein